MKLSVIVLAFVLVGLALTSETTLASNNNQGEKATSADAKEARWQGHIIRVNKDKSTLSIRGGQSNMESTERTIVYDDSTQWTKQGKPAEQSDFKQGSFVIVG